MTFELWHIVALIVIAAGGYLVSYIGGLRAGSEATIKLLSTRGVIEVEGTEIRPGGYHAAKKILLNGKEMTQEEKEAFRQKMLSTLDQYFTTKKDNE